MADHNKPTNTSLYADYTSEINGRFVDITVGLDPASTTATNVPDKAIRFNSANSRWEKYDLATTTWGVLDTGYEIDLAGSRKLTANTSDAAFTITQTGAGNAFVVEDSASPDATPVVIDADGTIIAGATSALTFNNLTARIQVNGTAFNTSTISTARFSANSSGASHTFAKSRGASVGTNTVVASGDSIGEILWRAADGTSYIDAASILASVDGTPGTNYMPGRLVFSTTPSGSATPVERMRIDSAGRLNMQTAMGTGGGSGTASTISGTTLTIGGTVGGFIAVGQRVWGAGVEPNTVITALGTGTGGAGTYIVNNSQTVSSTTISCIESGWNTFRFTDTDTTAAANQPMGQIEWFSSDASTPGAGVKAYITAVSESITPDAALIFGTSDNIADTQAVERMRIDSAGRVLIGTPTGISVGGTTPQSQLVGTSFGTSAFFAARYSASSGGVPMLFAKSRNATIGSHTIVGNGEEIGNIFYYGSDGTNFIEAARIGVQVDGTPGTNDIPGRLVFSTTADGASSPTEAMRLTSDKYLRMASGTGGIQFGGNTAAANALNDYEEGTWTVTLYDAGITGNASATTTTGNYIKIGDLVTITFSSLNNINTTGMTAGNVLYFSLPFTSKSGGAAVGTALLDSFTFPTSRILPNSIVDQGAARGYFQASASGQTDASFTVASITSGTSDIVRVTISYFAD